MFTQVASTFVAALFLAQIPAAAQSPAPALSPAPSEVDQALRARVTEFYQDHVNGKIRDALKLVAEDTQDYYLGAGKVHFTSFQIDDIKYSDNFTKAVVTLTVERMMQMELRQVPVKTAGPTNWKIEDGKWVWYRDANAENLTPMGLSNLATVKLNPNGTPQMPPKITSDSITAAARGILQQSNVDKPEITLSADKPSSDQVTFHNGAPGAVQLAVDGAAGLKGFRAELDKVTVNSGENAVLKLRYEPDTKAATSLPAATAPLNLRLIVAPFNQIFNITVKFAPSTR